MTFDLAAWGEAWSCGDPAPLLEFFAPDGSYRDEGSDATFTGHDAIARFYGLMLRFSSDSTVVFNEAHGDERGLAATWTWTGTANGPLRIRGTTYDASGKRFSVPGVAFCTLAPDGKLASHTDYYDIYPLILDAQGA